MNNEKKTLYLVRHAKALKGFPGIEDIDRPLHETGIIESYHIASGLLHQGEFPNRIVSSPAARAISTALIFQRVLRVPDEKVSVNARLYEADLNDLFEIVSGLDDQDQSVMLFGHNPSFTQYASKMDATIAHVATAAVIRFDFEVVKWRHCSYINADKKLFMSP
jgi:phosphohistidine phosphatase